VLARWRAVCPGIGADVSDNIPPAPGDVKRRHPNLRGDLDRDLAVTRAIGPSRSSARRGLLQF